MTIIYRYISQTSARVVRYNMVFHFNKKFHTYLVNGAFIQHSGFCSSFKANFYSVET